jgi:hypothetical protein
MFLLYHFDRHNTSGTMFHWCYVNDLHNTHAVVCWVTTSRAPTSILLAFASPLDLSHVVWLRRSSRSRPVLKMRHRHHDLEAGRHDQQQHSMQASSGTCIGGQHWGRRDSLALRAVGRRWGRRGSAVMFMHPRSTFFNCSPVLLIRNKLFAMMCSPMLPWWWDCYIPIFICYIPIFIWGNFIICPTLLGTSTNFPSLLCPLFFALFFLPLYYLPPIRPVPHAMTNIPPILVWPGSIDRGELACRFCLLSSFTGRAEEICRRLTNPLRAKVFVGRNPERRCKLETSRMTEEDRLFVYNNLTLDE